ncbi:MAG: peptidoglycan-binding protein [Xanthobacteraceae bacterium]
MTTRMTAIIVCLTLASMPALARRGHVHRPNTGPVPRPATSHQGPAKPATQIAETYAAMPTVQRLAIEADLAWTGYYQGLPDSEFADERAIDAVRLYQRAIKAKETGILDEQERARLAAAAEPHQTAVGWRLIDDPATGARFGLPEKLVSPLGASRIGSRWTSGHGQIEIVDFRLSEAGLPALFEQEKRNPKGRSVDSSTLRPDSFVISGSQGLKNFVIRTQARGSEVRGIRIFYDQATAGTMAPVATAVADSFQGFPDATATLPPGQVRTVEYGTAIVADRHGTLIATRNLTTGCATITVAGFGHAAPVAADAASDLALIRFYGAHDLVPAAIAGNGQGNDLTLLGIADPAAQGGGEEVSKAQAHLNGQTVDPAPRLGFSGAAAVDAQNRFAGIVELKPTTIAGAAGTGPTAMQAVLVPADTVRSFLAAHGITPAAGAGTISQSIVRVICVRE